MEELVFKKRSGIKGKGFMGNKKRHIFEQHFFSSLEVILSFDTQSLLTTFFRPDTSSLFTKNGVD
jgi:hypothetical protein